jgi:hypothetical protein
MLKNTVYTGILRSGETYTDVFPHMQIVDEITFEVSAGNGKNAL